ncbi:hypothetical protein KFK09_029053 [Dendrobium nobile]|uniref:Uncharacterized protein n=1 Tax=Dendrobium nobile TaxID=94219 RepID=A0A8T3A4Q1_DENNO|nr:hypothetical protein KFK09_029053 [Dendrobium nobile]
MKGKKLPALEKKKKLRLSRRMRVSSVTVLATAASDPKKVLSKSATREKKRRWRWFRIPKVRRTREGLPRSWSLQTERSREREPEVGLRFCWSCEREEKGGLLPSGTCEPPGETEGAGSVRLGLPRTREGEAEGVRPGL